jgi:hypothetical protein
MKILSIKFKWLKFKLFVYYKVLVLKAKILLRKAIKDAYFYFKYLFKSLLILLRKAINVSYLYFQLIFRSLTKRGVKTIQNIINSKKN